MGYTYLVDFVPLRKLIDREEHISPTFRSQSKCLYDNSQNKIKYNISTHAVIQQGQSNIKDLLTKLLCHNDFSVDIHNQFFL